MSAVQELRHIYQLNTKNFSRGEHLLLEGMLFANLCEELKLVMSEYGNDYFKLMKLDLEKVNTMVDENFVRNLVNDLIVSGEYSLSGIACYTNTPEEVVYDVVSGQNTNPTLLFAKRVIELHRVVRSELYQAIIEKIYKKQ